ncbi:MAG: DUF885 domain-containing protein [Panacagrimonas sp.]
MRRTGVALLSVLLLCACEPTPPVAEPPTSQAEVAPEAGTPAAALHALFEQTWERRLADAPSLATYLGDARYNDRWEDLSFDAIEARHQQDVQTLQRLQAQPFAQLSAEDQLNHELFRRDLQDRIDGHQFKRELMPLDQLRGVHLNAQMLEFMRFDTQQDYEHWLTRLQSYGSLVDQTIALMRRGMREGRVPPQIVMRRVPPQIAPQIVQRAADSPFHAPFKQFPDSIAPEVARQLDLGAQAAIEEVVIPALQRLLRFIEQDYLPACPANRFGLVGHPEGEAHYAYLVRHHTGSTLSPGEIHELGLSEVTRLRREFEALMRKDGHRGSIAAYRQRLTRDARYRYTDAESLLDAYRAIAKRIDPELPRLFGKLPRTPYGVRAMPALSAASAPAAYYYPPSADGTRAGYFYVNTDRPQSRDGWEMETLTAHEAVPGHHLQIALANELPGLPAFRRLGLDLTAFVEGWGLYAESLGGELGLYADPAARFGQLSFEMWRAVRLVVDTGLHAKGWSRRQAREYFAEHAPRAPAEIEVEVDRYIAMPGQALAYKLGQIKIRELRGRAQQRLEARFDVRGFHDTVLGQGPLPLEILEQNVDAWIETQAQIKPGP